MKICNNCFSEKEITEFYKNKFTKDKYENQCKKCRIAGMANKTEEQKRVRAERQRNFRAKHPEFVYNRARDNRYRRKYGVTVERYYELFKEQNGKCGICETTQISRKAFDVDHCHTTGKVRGLLCNNCNRGLGHFQDSIENLRKSIKYLENNGSL